MAIIAPVRYPVFEIRVVDGDTLAGWVEVARHCRLYRRVRLVHVEGGELPSQEGLRAQAFLSQQLANLGGDGWWVVGNEASVDKYGRWVADLASPACPSLVALLLRSGVYWRRDRTGREFRGVPVPDSILSGLPDGA